MTTHKNLARAGYIVTDAVLTALAREYASGVEQAEGVRGTYLRILVAHSKRELETRGVKRATADAAKAAVQAAHDQLYPVVLKAITTPDIAPDDDASAEETRRRTRERNRRSTFARTSKTTLIRWIEAGGRLVSLNPAEVTKEGLQALYAGARAGPGTPAQRVERLRTTMEKQIRDLLEEDADAARELVEDVVMKLQAIITPPKPLTRSRRRAGELVLHPH